ncbi:class II aldolase/adducin family protein [Amycolatopsis sp. K13G38]|uniref:Class II aldolase/adducin family protein n=1 Tax=Amycolatopsis acididurans TaxID=2724524 RepID=A0ABX1J1N5_9PSEU|nr:class II aldolase/adducin family protein [Amycolatopsis acididurans]NKQ52265.1 class II aldolase/adducin family protein [Amycolatopsis acididurans]
MTGFEAFATAEELRAVTEANWALAAAGQSDLVWGHVALGVAGGCALMKASGLGFEEVDAEDLVVVDRAGSVRAGTGRRHLEYCIHTEILAARADVGAVVHTHAIAAAAFASLDEPLRPLTHDAIPFLDPDIPRFTKTGNLISTPALGEELASCLGGNNGCLIPGHGLVTVGPSLASAVMHAALLDRACRVQLHAMAAGGPRRWSGDAEVAAKRAGLWVESQLQAGYEYLVRRAKAAPMAT